MQVAYANAVNPSTAWKRIMEVKQRKYKLPKIVSEVVCEMYDVPREELLGPGNGNAHIAQAKQTYCALMRRVGQDKTAMGMYTFTYRDIGETFYHKMGGHSPTPRDHSSVHHNVKVCEQRLSLNHYSEFKEIFESCVIEIKNRLSNS